MAGSIKIFQFFQKFHQAIGIYPSQPNQKHRSTISTKTLLLICLAQFMFTIAVFLVFEAKSILDYGFTFFALICIINTTVVYLIFIWQSKNTLKFIENCEGFIEKRADSTVAYEKLIGKIELFNKFLCFPICITVVLVIFSAAPYTFARYYISDVGDDSFYLFLPAWYPFDWKTPSGYLMAWLSQCAGALPVGSIYIQFFNFVIGSCWLFIFIAEDITQDVAAVNVIAKTASGKNHAKLMKRFSDMVQIYSDAKLCVKEFNQINKYSFFAFFSWTMLGASSMLVTVQFELWADDSNLFEIILLIFLLIWMNVFNLSLCEPGARMTNQFIMVSDELSRCDWYLLPIEIQRMYLIFLSDTQNQIRMYSYANITCDRETSKKIINTAFSYFMTLRRFRA